MRRQPHRARRAHHAHCAARYAASRVRLSLHPVLAGEHGGKAAAGAEEAQSGFAAHHVAAVRRPLGVARTPRSSAGCAEGASSRKPLAWKKGPPAFWRSAGAWRVRSVTGLLALKAPMATRLAASGVRAQESTTKRTCSSSASGLSSIQPADSHQHRRRNYHDQRCHN